MPAISERVIHREELKNKWYTDIVGIHIDSTLHVTQDLFDILKASRWNKEWADYNNTHYSPGQVEQIIALFTLDPEDEIEEGRGDFVQWQEKLIDMQTQIAQIVTKKEISFEDAKIVVDTSQALDIYFNNFISPVESNPKYFRYIQTHVVYHDLYMKALVIKTLIDWYIKESWEIVDWNWFEKREGEVKSLEIFAQQFEKITHKNDISPAIQTQYDSYLGWIEKYFPSVVAKIGTVGENYFKDIDLGVFQDWSNRVTSAYDTLRIIHNRLNSTI